MLLPFGLRPHSSSTPELPNPYLHNPWYKNLKLVIGGPAFPRPVAAMCGFLILEMILFAGSRDTLNKYYSRTQQLLNSRHT